ncbi:MAG: rRNA pseudouridine synthase [Cyclobacteriaceae bacterium]|nr:rRNA pseudouridine synthase [Cyclobacteriaceae bacterium]
MARPRKTSGKTAFGKRSDAEKSFRNRRKEKPAGRGDGRSSFGKRSDSPARGSRFSRSEKPAFGKRESGERPRKFEKRFDADNSKPFKRKPFDSDDKPGFVRKSAGFGKKKFDRDGGEGFDKPKSNRFEKKRFGDSERSDKPAFKKRNASFGWGGFDKPGTEKRGFNSEQGDKPGFKKRTGRFDSRSAGPSKFVKKPFEKRAPREEEDKPFGKGSNYGLPYKRKPFNKHRDVKSTKRARTEDKPKSDSDLIRLNKFIANSGVGSRREADELIKMGLITVNGEVITEMGYKIKPTDEVRYEGKKLKAEKPVYILLNKPKGFITTTDDPQERKTVMNLVANAGSERIYPVGRLDRNTTGLLLLTNDGELADKLTHPSYNVKKIYRVELDKPITKNDFQKIKDGVYLEEGRAIVDDLAIVEGDNKTVGIELHIGWNRIVRRIFESLGYAVEKLDRVVYAGLDKKDLGRGEWRFLKPEEIIRLKHFK